MAAPSDKERPITSWRDLTRELKEARDPSHGASIISRAITDLMFINGVGEKPRKECNNPANRIGSLKTKIMRLFQVDKP